jgi:hypothetical protein
VLVGAGVIGLATTLIPLAVPGVARLADVDPAPSGTEVAHRSGPPEPDSREAERNSVG